MPKMQANDKFQGLCLEQEEGAGRRYMYLYDEFPPEVRKRLQQSPYNLCAACLNAKGAYHSGLRGLIAIAEMERLIRDGEKHENT